MITVENNLFVLETAHTGYAFDVMEDGLCRHLYYGSRLPRTEDYRAAAPQPLFPVGNGAVCENGQCLEDLAQECGSVGWGDLRQSLADVTLCDGGRAASFRFAYFERLGDAAPKGLPDAIGGDETLKLVLKERSCELYLELYYTVFEKADAIVRWSRLVNDTGESVTVRRLLSAQLDLPGGRDYTLTTFRGAWAREMDRVDQRVQGTLLWDSTAGVSSNRCNPFAMVSAAEATETAGEVWAFNLLYSGNHYGCAQQNSYGSVRVVQGMGMDGFSWQLASGESLDAPQAVMAYSAEGFGGVSRCMHQFVRRHIIRPQWQDRERPVLVNSWEGFYFKLNKSKILRLAKEAGNLGVELLVVDDGWFRGRSDDRRALGDWTEDPRKLPGGFAALAAELKKLDVALGVWVEPEMVSENSDLFRSHSDWILGHRVQAVGRNQYVLDLGRSEVCDYIYESMARLLRSADIRYIKWDMNRILTDTFSPALPAARQGEAAHRYVLGLYSVLQRLRDEFPEVLFESCSSGGNRADLGMLCYMPQVWASDNTDALCRRSIQSGYSYGYPQSVLGCHVSASPNHQTLRHTPLHTRFHMACFGLLGYELDLCELTSAEKEEVKQQIALYKQHRRLFQFGQLYRVTETENQQFTMVVSEDQSAAVGMHFVRENRPNQGLAPLRAAGLAPQQLYHLTSQVQAVRLQDFGSLVNMISPVRLRPGSAVHALADKVVHLQEKAVDITASGQMFCAAGFYPTQPFSGTGYADGTRVMKDCDSRLYFWEKA
ncbi:MAG: alpha-galactosidase [Oscillospiraceae bacterium]|nr:alpha-galactosidase [Oscillospiraceae bacterium]